MGLDELIAPRRTYGRIDEHDGEYVETEFRCLGGLRIPLVPVRSFWIAGDRGRQRTGFPIELQPRSVAAAYLRIWAPGIATAVLVVGSSSLAAAIATALFGLSAWSWTWWPRDAARRRRSDFDLAAFGSRCDPARMTDEMHRSLANQLAQRAGAHAEPRSPDNVARYGPRSEDEALHAYGALRLRDARNPPQRSPGRLFDAGDAGWMLSRAVRRRRPRGGPYRDRFGANAPELWAMLSDCAQVSVHARRAGPLRAHAAVPGPGLVVPSWVRTPWRWLAVLAVATVVSGTALAVVSRALAPPALPRVTAATLIDALAAAASLATLAGWFVWLRLWQHRRRVATWILPP